MLKYLFASISFAVFNLALAKVYHKENSETQSREAPFGFEKTEKQLREDIVIFARAKIGVAKYVWGKPPPDTGLQYDCSGFAQWMTIKALTYDPFIEKISSGDFYKELESMGAKLDNCDEAKPGDIIHWEGHVGIIADPAQGTFVGAQGKDTGITEEVYKEGYWSKGKTCFTNKFLVPDYKKLNVHCGAIASRTRSC